MNRVAKPQSLSAWQASFLAMLPAIVTHARVAFRRLDPDAKAEAVQEVVANAFVAFARLVQLGKIDIAYASPLARYAVAQVNDGRKVGNHLNINEVLSSYAQKRRGITVERLDHFDEEENAWREAVVQDTRTCARYRRSSPSAAILPTGFTAFPVVTAGSPSSLPSATVPGRPPGSSACAKVGSANSAKSCPSLGGSLSAKSRRPKRLVWRLLDPDNAHGRPGNRRTGCRGGVGRLRPPSVPVQDRHWFPT